MTGVQTCALPILDAVEVVAERIGISEVIIASTIVAFGTSVPEISTALTAVRKGRGGLAIGNVLGANVLNILLVLGASLALSPEGITIPLNFYRVPIPALIVVLGFFGFFMYNRKKHVISKTEGISLILLYILYLLGNVIYAF